MVWRLKWIIGLLLLVTPAYGVDFETLVGSDVPSLKSADLYPYFKHDLIPLRIAECEDAAHSTTYYVNYTSGSDSNSGLTTSLALKTIDGTGGVNDKIAASSGNISVLFIRDQRHPSTEGILIDGKNGVYVGAYGTGKKPVIHCFTQSTTSFASDTSAYSIAAATGVAWVREATNDYTRLYPIRRRSSQANVVATNRSFWWDDPNDKLWLQYDGTSPAGITFEYSYETIAAQDGVKVNAADQVMVDGIIVEGFGCHIDGTKDKYGFKVDGDAGRVVFRDCEAYYCGSHAFGSTGGGICTFQRCVGGFCHHTSTTTFVYYEGTFESTDECIFDECVCRFGYLPYESLASSAISDSSHQGFYSHNVGGADYPTLILAIDCSEPAETYRTDYTATYGDIYFANVAGDGTEAAVRAFVLNHSVERSVRGKWGFAKNHLYAGCRYRVVYPYDNTNTQLYSSPSATANLFMYRCLFDVTDMRVTADVTRDCLPVGYHNLDGCSFSFNGARSTSEFRIVAAAAVNFVGRNCLIVKNGDNVIWNGAGNNSNRWINLAHYGVNTGTGSDDGFGNVATLVALTAAPRYPWMLPTGTLAETGASTDGPDYDLFWRRCGTGRSYGAVESNPDTMTGTLYQYLQDGVKLRRVNP